MKPLHRHRPTFPELMGAVAYLLGGVFCFGMIYYHIQSGEIGEEKLKALILISLATTCIFLIAAFARYPFIHLWKKQNRKQHR